MKLFSIFSKSSIIQRILLDGKKQGMVTFREDGVLKALDGLVSIEEVIRETAE